MSDNKTGWGTLITGLATAGLAVVAYMTYAHPRGGSDEQSFSVPVKSEPSNAPGTKQQAKDSSLNFQVKKCDVGSKLVSCSLSVVSPKYDRRLDIGNYAESGLIDSDGDHYHMDQAQIVLSLERDRALNFKLSFQVNKDVVRPLTVRMYGNIDDQRFQHSFDIK